ncbi:MAG: HU family DNA-binding protein [Thiomicrorhabdus sp.]|nr:HU family DNA-binding protein [Thiomicrorhabdus sp.]
MNRKEIINAIACKTGKSKADIKRILDVFMDTVGDTLTDGDKVRLTGFGTFSVITRAQREGRNPQTGAPITIKKRKVVRFKAGSDLAANVR